MGRLILPIAMTNRSPCVHKPASPAPLCIISGGQTGVDRAALDVAAECHLPVGGWCPRGRRAEDGRIPDHYPLRETESADYAVRTEYNVRDSDATLILAVGPLSGGTALTKQLAEQWRKPLRVVDLQNPPPVGPVIQWLQEHKVRVLNVAGPRAGTHPDVEQRARDFLRPLFRQIARPR